MIEKERKWLLKDRPYLKFDKSQAITQFYLDGYRYRLTQDSSGEYVAERIKKTKVSKGVNAELEINSISKEEFTELFTDKTPFVSKIRHTYEFKDKVFEVDEFSSCSLIMLEVEDVDLGEKIEFPPEIERCIVLEVTGMEQFDNFNIAK